MAKAKKATSPPRRNILPIRLMKRWSRWWLKEMMNLMEEFFATGTLPVEHIVTGLKEAVASRRIFPILCLSASHNIGTTSRSPHLRDLPFSNEIEKKVSPTDSVSAFVFKTSADPFAGRVTFFKVMSGLLKDDAHLNNMRSMSTSDWPISPLPSAKTLQPVTELRAAISVSSRNSKTR